MIAMSNIKRVTIVISEPMMDSVRTAVERGAFITTNDAFRGAAQMWCVAPERRPHTIDAPSIASDVVDCSPALQQLR
jgi:hypothetical protein